ncbi:type VI secretion system baseplate subunit TssF [Acetobacter sp.]|jgi:type VI secretion system protein ImpG|uniref:type VI secretion system baseplate subunit TssF n=1 Tax=Acetobacter sp. TaxID=440 RepID=UPI0025BBB482|nr:type VI secretion system baseplate subunit TssF [Acetobacter sp.]MCH4092640.1 type VI secretion system baseplate subunit TssF [Acetobacter sp.]MCI1299774.1 type VI secretion system baseplate subunit TssF [Acetobacter sp.]MCI1315346.1 type VI secretion system baseplate subunit TssF [Acetobacter sp.]
MENPFFRYYNRELTALRKLASEFAEANPKAAGHLRISADTVDDPHVARLLEGVAFLSGRVHQRLDEEFPELTDGLLGILYPHYNAPVPAASIVEMVCRPDRDAIGMTVPRETVVETDPIGGKPCYFRTTAEARLWPVRIARLTLSGLPLAAPSNPLARGARSVLRIMLESTDPDITFADMGLEKLRFFLKNSSGQGYRLLELLGRHTLSVACASSPNDPAPTLLPKESVLPCGFDPEEALLPWTARSFSGFRLLTEYFAFPEKFLFVELDGLDARTLVHDERKMEIFVYFDASFPELERTLLPDALALGCVPVVNLFPQRCEPVTLTHETTEYRVAASHRDPDHYEIWSVERVREMEGAGASRPWMPLYHRPPQELRSDGRGQPASYTLTRRPAPTELGGTEVYLAPVQPDLDPEGPTDHILLIDALCTNRNLPERLPFGGGEPVLRVPAMADRLASVSCVMPFSSTVRPSLAGDRAWRLIAHLALGHISLTEPGAGSRIIQDLLTLYDCRETPETRKVIDSLVDVIAQPGHARLPGVRPGGFIRGTDITLVFAPDGWEAGGLYLLASILERFLALHVSVNSFVRVSVALQGRTGFIARFPRRCGTRTLL